MNGIRVSLITAILVGIFAYFLYHTIYGNRGLVAKYDLEEKISSSENELEKIREKRIELEHRVKLLRPGSLDKDMLEEEARKVLGIAKEGEEVLIKDQVKDENIDKNKEN